MVCVKLLRCLLLFVVCYSSPAVYEPGLPRSYQAGLIALYSVTTAMAVMGNLLVIGVLTVGQLSRTDLRVYLLSLAVADLMMATFCMPFTFTTTMLHSWIFGALMCPLVVFMQVYVATKLVTVTESTYCTCTCS